ncbi:hybrid sensor histidine kinase/response regulator [Motilimonas eburnea]|uniref:hybrid sensor histidine kinase/response regulator n=1 Tax=Motilimonas eburnea TaxID=1737488 RepID=UPI001E3958F1|nr:PAS domain-containing hybrid sensor histidine kinase/response regulator [Motilimonas eburnea]MCE2572779.1 PAS-domain containing protein [Motilimonas eburnea]
MDLGWLVAPVSVAYLCVLFLIAWLGDRLTAKRLKWQPLIYSLSIGVYCTSWSFFGTVGQASTDFWSFIPIYLGPILMFAFGWKLIGRIILIAKREHITSIADFIASRYGKSQKLAMVITLIAIIGILPYIALQLRAIVMGLELLGTPTVSSAYNSDNAGLMALLVSLALAMFTILFGTRKIDITEHHRGMVIAVAFESLVKLVTFVAVGVFAAYVFYTAPSAITEPIQAQFNQQASYLSWGQGIEMLVLTLLAAFAMVCLPRQFHVTVVENSQGQDIHWARWLFPIYLLAMGAFVLPLAMAGQLWLGSDVSPDHYVISLPMAFDHPYLAIAAYLGGMSAASGMVIVATIALSIMISNDIVLPLLLRRQNFEQNSFVEFKDLLIKVRRTAIVVILLLAWGAHLLLSQLESLAAIGVLSFAAIALFAPALIMGLFWRNANRKGVYVGLALGFSFWLLTLCHELNWLPGDAQSNSLIWLITPPQFGVFIDLSPAYWGIILSLLSNLLGYLVGSSLSSPALSERMQASSFVGNVDKDPVAFYQAKVRIEELEMLATRFLGRRRVKLHFSRYARINDLVLKPEMQAPGSLIELTERLLAGVFGASSARLVLSSALQGRDMQLDELATIVDEASELFQFNRGLLQGAIEHINQGISVVDSQLQLVAWNRRYIELFNFPKELIQVGRPIEDIMRYNAEQGLLGLGDIESQIAKRLEHMRNGTPHESSRTRLDGREIQMQGNPMPGGGFVMTFNDITPFRQAEKALKEANENLEARVAERTEALSHLNSQLMYATELSEQANLSKTRFLAAVSHDLMQPLNAAKLFTSSLREMANTPETSTLAKHIDDSLTSAEELIGDLLDMSRLEAGKLTPKLKHFYLNDVLSQLDAEFSVLGKEYGVRFHTQHAHLPVYSDPKLLRRILQNFLTNAFRYNPQGKVLLGVRRVAGEVEIQVWDNGPGIPEHKLADIFEEFLRLDHSKTAQEQGLGLGLAIAKGLAKLLGHQLLVRSWPNKGTVFSVRLARAEPALVAKEQTITNTAVGIEGIRILCIDNEVDILAGMQALLGRWGCEVEVAESLDQAVALLAKGWLPQIILSDYHLGEGKTGLQALHMLRLQYGDIPGVVISADRQTEMLAKIKSHGYRYLSKPVKPLKLKALIRAILDGA